MGSNWRNIFKNDVKGQGMHAGAKEQQTLKNELQLTRTKRQTYDSI